MNGGQEGRRSRTLRGAVSSDGGLWAEGIDTGGPWSGTDGTPAGGAGRARGRGGPVGRGNDALSGRRAAPQEEREDKEADVEHMEARPQTRYQINICCGRDGGVVYRRLIRAARSGC